MQVKFKNATPERFSIFYAKRRMKHLDKRSNRRPSLRPFGKLQHAKESLITQALKKADIEELQDWGSCRVASENVVEVKYNLRENTMKAYRIYKQNNGESEYIKTVHSEEELKENASKATSPLKEIDVDLMEFWVEDVEFRVVIDEH